MKKLKEGFKAPDFRLPDQEGKEHRLKDYEGRWVLLYFYPRDDTPGCTKEACGLRDERSKYSRQKAVILGVSTDSVDSHARFADKYDLPFPLLADEEGKVVRRYGVWGKKKFMGREYEGTHRMSFLIGPDRRIARIYRKVKPAEHAAQVLEDLKTLKKNGVRHQRSS